MSGANGHGQLGDGTTNGRDELDTLDHDVTYVDLALGASHACGVTQQGSLKCWGNPSGGRVARRHFPTLSFRGVDDVESAPTITAIVGSRNHGRDGCTILEGSFEQCTPIGDRPLPNQYRQGQWLRGGASESTITLGEAHVCILSKTSDIRCRGDNWYGQFGDGSLDSSFPFVASGGDASDAYESVSAGPEFTCGLTDSGDVRCWGWSPHGVLDGAGETTVKRPTDVSGNRRFETIAVGRSHLCGLTMDGEAYCRGDNRFGQLGTGEESDLAAEFGRVATDASYRSIHSVLIPAR